MFTRILIQQYWNKWQISFQVFTANSDGGTVVSHKLSPRISTRYVRFSVLSWYGYICMRVELYGCANESWPFPENFNQGIIEKTAGQGLAEIHTNPLNPIGHFRVHLSLHFKSRLSAKSLLWKSVFIHIEIATNYHNKNFGLRVALKERPKENRKWPILA